MTAGGHLRRVEGDSLLRILDGVSHTPADRDPVADDHLYLDTDWQALDYLVSGEYSEEPLAWAVRGRYRSRVDLEGADTRSRIGPADVQRVAAALLELSEAAVTGRCDPQKLDQLGLNPGYRERTDEGGRVRERLRDRFLEIREFYRVAAERRMGVIAWQL